MSGGGANSDVEKRLDVLASKVRNLQDTIEQEVCPPKDDLSKVKAEFAEFRTYSNTRINELEAQVAGLLGKQRADASRSPIDQLTPPSSDRAMELPGDVLGQLKTMQDQLNRLMSKSRWTQDSVQDLYTRMERLEAKQGGTQATALKDQLGHVALAMPAPHLPLAPIPAPSAVFVAEAVAGVEPSVAPHGKAVVETSRPSGPPVAFQPLKAGSPSLATTTRVHRASTTAGCTRSMSARNLSYPSPSDARPRRPATIHSPRPPSPQVTGTGTDCESRLPAFVFQHPEDPEVRAITTEIETDLMRNLGASRNDKMCLLDNQRRKCDGASGPKAALWYNQWLKDNEAWYLKL